MVVSIVDWQSSKTAILSRPRYTILGNTFNDDTFSYNLSMVAECRTQGSTPHQPYELTIYYLVIISHNDSVEAYYGPFKIGTFLSGFQMVFDKIAAIHPDFKCLDFRSDPIRNVKHLQTNFFLIIQNPD